MRRLIQIVIFGGLLLLFLSPSTIAQAEQAELPAQQTNLLTNPGFERPYQSDGAANGWGRWFRNSSEDKFADCTNGYHKRPQWSEESASAALIQAGSISQHIGNQWDTWQAGVLQTVNVTPGTTYRFTIQARAFASNNDFPQPSEGGIQSNVQIMIDPNGSGLWNDSDVMWSGVINPLDVWQSISLEATATGSQMTVFTSTDYGIEGVNQCRKHLDVWFDSAELIEVGPPPTNTPVPVPTNPPPPPATAVPPTATPIPATDTPDVPPTETPIPPTDTPVPPTGGTICVNAFADNNSNGARDDAEGYMGSVTFTVANGAQVVGQALSTGTADPFCFEGLEPGTYQVAQLVPGRLEMTTAANATVNVNEGSSVGVEFGSRIRPEGEQVAAVQPTAVSNPADTTSGDSTTDSGGVTGLSGLIVLIGAVVLLGGLLFFVLKRQTA